MFFIIEERRKIVFITLIFFLIMLGLSLYYGIQLLAQIDALKIEEQKADVQMAALLEDLEDAEDFMGKYERLKAEFEKYLFKDQDVPAFLDGISNIAKTESVDIISIRTRSFNRVQEKVSAEESAASSRDPKKPVKKEGEKKDAVVLASMPVNMTATGPFLNFLRFLKQVEQFEQLLTVSEISIVRGEYPELKYSFTIDIYSLTSVGALSK